MANRDRKNESPYTGPIVDALRKDIKEALASSGRSPVSSEEGYKFGQTEITTPTLNGAGKVKRVCDVTLG